MKIQMKLWIGVVLLLLMFMISGCNFAEFLGGGGDDANPTTGKLNVQTLQWVCRTLTVSGIGLMIAGAVLGSITRFTALPINFPKLSGSLFTLGLIMVGIVLFWMKYAWIVVLMAGVIAFGFILWLARKYWKKRKEL